MDIDATISDILTQFAEDILSKNNKTPPDHESLQKTIHEVKWKLLCTFAASKNTEDILHSMAEEIVLSIEPTN